MAILELAVDSFETAQMGEAAGAGRIELNAALPLGGLTPPWGVVKQCLQYLQIPLVVMLRNRASGFCYREPEFAALEYELEEFIRLGVKSFACGFLTAEGEVDVPRTQRICERIHKAGAELVFHRAFDNCRSPFAAAASLQAIGVDRVLSSGQAPTAWEGAALLGALNERFGASLSFLPAAGVNSAQAATLLRLSKAQGLHASCKSYLADATAVRQVSFALPGLEQPAAYPYLNQEEVRALVKVLAQATVSPSEALGEGV